ncbi:MAG TPA: DNA polymerase IV [Thermoleophilia bacterium]|nr:DNA polymerase IV [Thermoleophilia bacterium]
MSRAILLIDMDAFYASVEQARRPELAGLPVIVGGSAASRGVVSTASYEARACGVRTAMPAAQARRLCPQGVFLPVDMKAYLAMQEKLLEIFGRFTDLVEPVSIDEAFLDVTGSRRLFGSAQDIARRIRQLVRDELGLSCSIGVGPTRLLAKMAAELDKPGGLTTLSNDDVHGRLRELPVRRLYGIGPVTEERLRSLGLTTIARLQDVPDEVLAGAFPTGSAALKELAFGGSDDVVRAGHAPPKSMGHEVTFARDIDDPELLQATLLDLADRTAGDLRRKGYACRTLALKLRDERFRTFGGQRTLPDATSSTKVIYETASALLCDLHASGCRLRLLGLTLSGLACEARQLELDDSSREAARDDAVDRVRAKYGTGALRRAGAHLAPYHQGPELPGKPGAER